MTPVDIKGTRIGDEAGAGSTVRVDHGVGMKSIDAPVNELGIEVKTLEQTQDIGGERREPNWWLLPPDEKRWHYGAHADLSVDQSAKLRAVGPIPELATDVRVEGGLARDRHPISYLDNGGTLYQSNDDVVRTYAAKKDSNFVQLVAEDRRGSWKGLFGRDELADDVRAGSGLIGNKHQAFYETGADIKVLRGLRLAPYGQANQQEFRAETAGLLSSRSQDLKGGLQARWFAFGPVSLLAEGFHEDLGRDFSDESRVAFSRDDGRLKLVAQNERASLVELKAHAFAEVARDRAGTGAGALADTIWDTGVEVSSSHAHGIGLKAKARRYALIPTPQQRFGDGGLLQPNLALSPETGIRGGAGPWLETKNVLIEVLAFAEQGRDIPIPVGVSPTSAKYVGVGGIWSRGIDAMATARAWDFTANATATYQDALNASNINWARGQPVPGRPKWAAHVSLEYARSYYGAGAQYEYRGIDALDLGGAWSRPARQSAGAFVAYRRQSWEARVVGKNLWLSPEATEPLWFNGAAGPNVLEPEILERQVRLQWEIMI